MLGYKPQARGIPMTRTQVFRILAYSAAIACAVAHLYGCSTYPGEVYIECSGKGDFHFAITAQSIDCPPPGLKLSIGRQGPQAAPGSTNTLSQNPSPAGKP
jgi:hypothetical protein